MTDPSPADPTPLPVLPPGDGTTPAPALGRPRGRAVPAALYVAADRAEAIAGAIDSLRGPRP